MTIVPQVDPLVTFDLSGRLPMPAETHVSEVDCDWERIVRNRLLHDAPEDSTYTNHALMVPYGHLAQELGLVDGLLDVPVPQKHYYHKPSKKILEYLMSILSGAEYLKDLNEAPHPLVKDQAVIEAWGQEDLAHYSGVSRTLAASDDRTVEAVKKVLGSIIQPVIDHERAIALRGDGYLVWDGDLTSRQVSSTSTTYPGAAFGWMGDGWAWAIRRRSSVWRALPMVGCGWLGSTIPATPSLSSVPRSWSEARRPKLGPILGEGWNWWIDDWRLWLRRSTNAVVGSPAKRPNEPEPRPPTSNCGSEFHSSSRRWRNAGLGTRKQDAR